MVLAVAVTFPFVHPLGLYENDTFALVKLVTLPTDICFVYIHLLLPALSYTYTCVLYVPVSFLWSAILT